MDIPNKCYEEDSRYWKSLGQPATNSRLNMATLLVVLMHRDARTSQKEIQAQSGLENGGREGRECGSRKIKQNKQQ